MASQGPSNGGAAVSTDTDPGEFPWIDPTNVLIPDGAGTTATAPRDDVISDALDVTDFGFTIPNGSSIDGIELTLTKKASLVDDGITDWVVQLLDAGSPVGDNKRDFGVNWPNTYNAHVYGGSADTWGYAWTPAKINASGFGIRVECHIVIEAGIAYIDAAQLTITYTEGAVTHTMVAPFTINANRIVGTGCL